MVEDVVALALFVGLNVSSAQLPFYELYISKSLANCQSSTTLTDTSSFSFSNKYQSNVAPSCTITMCFSRNTQVITLFNVSCSNEYSIYTYTLLKFNVWMRCSFGQAMLKSGRYNHHQHNIHFFFYLYYILFWYYKNVV